MSARGLPVLAPGSEIRLGGQIYQVVALDGSSVQLVDVTGAAVVMLTGRLLADPSFELVTSRRRVPPAVSGLEQLPEEVRAGAQWWEQHLVEVLTGSRPMRCQAPRRGRSTILGAVRCGSGSWPSTPSWPPPATTLR